MENERKRAKQVTGIDLHLFKAIKNAAVDRNISDNEMYLRLLKSGAKRLKVVADKPEEGI